MKKYSTTYNRITKLTALLLLLAFLIPSGLQAKQFVDFCLMDTHNVEMEKDHSCCESEEKQDSESSDHSCAVMGICACNIGDTTLKDYDWVIPNSDFSVVLFETDTLFSFINSDETILTNHRKQSPGHSPPLWLVYDTLLIYKHFIYQNECRRSLKTSFKGFFQVIHNHKSIFEHP